MVRPHIVACICLVLLSGCATAADKPRLSRQTALRLADERVADVLRPRYAPRSFQPPDANYAADKRVWYVAYRRIGQRYADFTVEVDDQTRRASVLMP